MDFAPTYGGISRIGLPRTVMLALACMLMAACSSGKAPSYPPTASRNVPEKAPAATTSRKAPQKQLFSNIGRPRIVNGKRRLECVIYARGLTGIDLSGDAWTWWRGAAGRYRRGNIPEVGATLVMGRKGRSRGHLAVVVRVVSAREVVTRHANWLNNGQIHLDTPVRDVSRRGDWSAVRVWYVPGNVLGKSTYPAYGFIYAP